MTTISDQPREDDTNSAEVPNCTLQTHVSQFQEAAIPAEELTDWPALIEEAVGCGGATVSSPMILYDQSSVPMRQL